MILAAGIGSRLKPLTDDLPKVMLPIVNGRPLLEHIILLMKNQGFDDFIINLHYRPEKITDYFGDGRKLGVKIAYSAEAGQLLETGGAIKKAEDILSDDFILIYGDMVHFFDFSAALEFHRQRRALATIILKRSDHPQNGDLFEVDSSTGRITKSYPRPHNFSDFGGQLWLNGGLFVLSKKILDHIPAGRPVKLDIDVIPVLVKSGFDIFGLISKDDILDIGTPEKYQLAREWYGKTKQIFEN